jgi:hypothetical protein
MTPKPKALTLAAFGARGTGKTAWVKQQIERINPPRLMIWDFKHDPPLDTIGKPVANMPEFIKTMKKPVFKLRYMVDHTRDIQAQFDLFCQAAWLAGNVMLFVDELPEVTKANKAPAAWRRCVNVGRLYRGQDGKERSISIIGAGQRPAECDKSFISNCDVIHTGRLSNPDDARELAKSIGCDFRELMSLPDLHWLERDSAKVEFTRGILTFSKKRPAAKTPALEDAPK